jgi:hypothetical protein
MTSKPIENSIFWQNQVIKQSQNPAQIARCKAAIVKLQAELRAALLKEGKA